MFDVIKVFFNIPLAKSSKLLTAMITLIGVYVFNIVAMRLSCSDD